MFRKPVLGALALALLAAGCGSAAPKSASQGSSAATSSSAASKSRTSSASSSGASTPKASVNVAYAGSLQLVNDKLVGPAFQKATGDSYQGRGGGSFGVAHLIQSGSLNPDVFEPVGSGPFKPLTPAKATWAIGFASSPLVVAYNAKSPYAKELNQIAKGQRPLKDLFTLMQQPGFHLGRTDPATDPQGQDFLLMLKLAESHFNLASGTAQKIYGTPENPKQVFSETAILSRLQAGQLDASSAYLPEAVERHLPYIALPSAINLGDPAQASAYQKASVTLKDGTVVHGAPIEVYISELKSAADPKGAADFINFVLSSQGGKLYHQEGYTLTKPIIWGQRSDIPKAISANLK